jgi:hypothetical protein
MTDDTLRQSIIDEEHLKLLSLGYMVSGGLAAMFSMFGLLYVFMGIVMSVALSHAPQTAGKPGELPPTFVGWFLGAIGLTMFLAMIAMAAAKFWVALSIRRRKSRTFCLVIAAIGCLEFPYGTLLGALSFIVLSRDSVVRLFTSTVPGANVST